MKFVCPNCNREIDYLGGEACLLKKPHAFQVKLTQDTKDLGESFKYIFDFRSWGEPALDYEKQCEFICPRCKHKFDNLDVFIKKEPGENEENIFRSYN